MFALLALSAILALGCLVLHRRWRRSNDTVDSVRSDHERLEHSVRHDSLSGLLNRFGLLERLEARLETGRDDFSVLYLDIDRFKSVNDTLGHATGDSLLTAIARRLDHVVGSCGDVARLGGDEFVVIVDDSPNVDVRRVADRLTRSVVEPVEVQGRLLRVSASIGLATGPWAERSAIAVLEHANHALHRAKEHGRDRIEVYSPEMRLDEMRRAADEVELRRALDRGELRPFFVPEFDHEAGRLVGAEIVPRWIRVDGSIVDGPRLLDLARDANTVERLTATLVREARPFLRRLELFGLPPGFRFRIELPRRCTPRAWRDGQIAAAFNDVDLSTLTLEMTSTILSIDAENSARVLGQLRDRGARICLRNVGDLTTLGALTVDEIRVSDRLVQGREPFDDALLRAVADLTRRLGLILSADGVVSPDEFARLSAHGCHRHGGPNPGPALSFEDFQVEVEKDLVRHQITPAVP